MNAQAPPIKVMPRSTQGIMAVTTGLLLTAGSAIPFFYPDYSGAPHFLLVFLAVCFFPGLLVGALLGGNVHEASRVLAIVLNGILYSSIFYAAIRWWNRRKSENRGD